MIQDFMSDIISILISYIFTKWQMKKTPIIHSFNKPMGITDGLDNVCPEILDNFINDRLEGDIKLLKGCFINEGSDLVIYADNNNINLILPNGCEVIDVKIQSSNDLEIKSNYENNYIIFYLPPSFLSNESFNYYVIYKGQDEENFEIKTRTRIASVSLKDKLISKFKIKDIIFHSNEILKNTAGLATIISTLITVFTYFKDIYSNNPIEPETSNMPEYNIPLLIIVAISIVTTLLLVLVLTLIFRNKNKK